jgi:uncharacterized protein with HEPN domain
MPSEAAARLLDMKERIVLIRGLLREMTYEEVVANVHVMAAFERYLEIISEASRNVPGRWKAAHPEIPWRDVGDIGNAVRHVYHRINPVRLWSVYTDDLDALENAVDAMIAKHGT